MPISRGVTRKFARSLSRAFVRSAKNNIVPFFLERFPGASVAYSLRQLHPDAIFAIRVRRSSDDQEMDIGFTSTGLLDESALLLFVGSGDGFVVIWYDQSGNNNHASQSVASQQPKIVNAGTVIKENGKPAIEFDGVDDDLTVTLPSYDNQDFSIYLVYNFVTLPSGDGSSNRITLFRHKGSQWSPGLWQSLDSIRPHAQESFGLYVDYLMTADTQQHLFSYSFINSTNSFISALDNSVLSSDSFSTFDSFSGSGSFAIGSENGTYHFGGKIQELILYPSDQSANRSDMNTAILNHYTSS